MKLLFLLLFILVYEARAFDNPYTMRSPEALLMGDANTAVNSDSFTLFYNPASMARHKADFTLNPFNPQASGTNILADMDRFKNFPDEPVGVSKVLMNYPAHASVGISPGFKMFNVGVSFLAQDSYDLMLRNRANPILDLDIRSDRGVLVGAGIPIGPRRLNKKSKMGSQTSIGLGAKYIERSGVNDRLALAGPTVTNSLGQDDIDKIVKSLGRVKGVGFGFDAGLEHVEKSGNGQLVLGLAAMDIGGTDFRVGKNPDNLKVANIRNQVNLGIAGGHDYRFFHYILSADVRALNEEMDFGKRLRLGAQVGIPGLKLMAGMNSGYYSYGATVDLAFIKLTAGFYDTELGSTYKQIQSKRFIIYLSLFDFSFDA
jgi:hypothetical protein